MGGDEGIQGANGVAVLLQRRSHRPADVGGFFIEGRNDEVEQELFKQGEVGFWESKGPCSNISCDLALKK